MYKVEIHSFNKEAKMHDNYLDFGSGCALGFIAGLVISAIMIAWRF